MPDPSQQPISQILLHGEQAGGHVSLVHNVVPAHSPGPPLHQHGFDEAFYVLEGELLFQLGDHRVSKGPGQLAFAPRDTAHGLANPHDTPARYLLVCTPAGFERQFARMSAAAAGVEPPAWALGDIPEVITLGPPIGQEPNTQ